jgi:cytochrome oxidase Cu insertion factor (SCO1/SenC/PrrC family)
VKGVRAIFRLRYYVDTESGNEQVIHSLGTAVISPDGKLIKPYRGNEWKPEEVLNDLRAAAQNANSVTDERR